MKEICFWTWCILSRCCHSSKCVPCRWSVSVFSCTAKMETNETSLLTLRLHLCYSVMSILSEKKSPRSVCSFGSELMPSGCTFYRSLDHYDWIPLTHWCIFPYRNIIKILQHLFKLVTLLYIDWYKPLSINDWQSLIFPKGFFCTTWQPKTYPLLTIFKVCSDNLQNLFNGCLYKQHICI